MYTSPAVRAEIKSPEFSGVRWIRPGALWVMPQGCRHEVRFEGVVEGVALAFDPVRFDNLVESAGGKSSTPIIQSLAASPPKIEHLMRAPDHESKLPSTHDHFGLECIATAIALALSQHARAIAAPPKAGPEANSRGSVLRGGTPGAAHCFGRISYRRGVELLSLSSRVQAKHGSYTRPNMFSSSVWSERGPCSRPAT